MFKNSWPRCKGGFSWRLDLHHYSDRPNSPEKIRKKKTRKNGPCWAMLNNKNPTVNPAENVFPSESWKNYHVFFFKFYPFHPEPAEKKKTQKINPREKKNGPILEWKVGGKFYYPKVLFLKKSIPLKNQYLTSNLRIRHII